mmetsp:Transcript_29546/g.96545  ORF Transcript_29546/g.96545 Transcript_29546/m.96545 type:complete len:230 (+) Transcript_29546:1193-1882(+)
MRLAWVRMRMPPLARLRWPFARAFWTHCSGRRARAVDHEAGRVQAERGPLGRDQWQQALVQVQAVVGSSSSIANNKIAHCQCKTCQLQSLLLLLKRGMRQAIQRVCRRSCALPLLLHPCSSESHSCQWPALFTAQHLLPPHPTFTRTCQHSRPQRFHRVHRSHPRLRTERGKPQHKVPQRPISQVVEAWMGQGLCSVAPPSLHGGEALRLPECSSWMMRGPTDDCCTAC